MVLTYELDKLLVDEMRGKGLSTNLWINNIWTINLLLVTLFFHIILSTQEKERVKLTHIQCPLNQNVDFIINFLLNVDLQGK